MSEPPPGEPPKEPITFGKLFPGLLVAAIAGPIVAAVAAGLIIGGAFSDVDAIRALAAVVIAAAWIGLLVFVYRRDRNFGLGMFLGSVVGLLRARRHPLH